MKLQLKCFVLSLAMLALVPFGQVALAEDAVATVLFDRWYSVLIGDQPAGWMHMQQQQAGKDGPITSRNHMKLTIKRGPATLTVETFGDFTELPDGTPMAAQSRQIMAKFEQIKSLLFNGDGIELITEQGGIKKKQMLPQPKGKWLAPAAAARYVEAQIAKGEKVIKFRTLDPAMGVDIVEMTKTLRGRENVEVMGKTVPAIVWDSQITGLPINSVEYVDDQGQPVKTTMQLPGVAMTVVQTEKEIAVAKVNPPELLAQTLIKPDREIAAPRAARSAVYEVVYDAPKAGEPVKKNEIVQTGFQRVVWGDNRTARVVIDMQSPVAPGKDLPKDVHSKATPSLNSDDPAIKKLVATAMKDEAARNRVAKLFGDKPDALSAPAKAELLRRFVNGFIDKKDLEVGFATASEVARTGKGDCTEHGVLLAALLRAAGIPSRTASGLIYVKQFIGQRGVFGYHMWTQAWLPKGPADGDDAPQGGRWVDLDATLPDKPFDAAHITLSTSAMSERGMTNDMVAMVSTLGRIKIKVIEVGGK